MVTSPSFSLPSPLQPLTPFFFRYSPRDFICDQLEDYEPDRIERDDGGTVVITLGDMPSLGLDVPAGAVPRIRGRISLRMLAAGNLWYTTWSKSKPLAAANQKPIFDSFKEAEMVLHDLENISPRILWQELLLSSVASAYHSLSIAGASHRITTRDTLAHPSLIAAGAQLDCVLALLECVASNCCR
jgi:hypothetical protein